jgi:hypothetical protein
LKTSSAMLRITSAQSLSPNTHDVISEWSRPCYWSELPDGRPVGGADLIFGLSAKAIIAFTAYYPFWISFWASLRV